MAAKSQYEDVSLSVSVSVCISSSLREESVGLGRWGTGVVVTTLLIVFSQMLRTPAEAQPPVGRYTRKCADQAEQRGFKHLASHDLN